MANEVTKEIGITVDEFARQAREAWLIKGKGLRFDINQHVDDENFVLKVRSGGETHDIAGLGAIGVVVGPAKSRKTAVVSGIIASALGNCEVMGFTMDISGDRIIYNDTEQREGSFAKVNKNIYKWAKIPKGINPLNYEAYKLRAMYPPDRVEFIKAHVQTGVTPSLLVIDVVSDLLYDFNDITQSQQMVEEIMKLAGSKTLTILTLHVGKGGLILGHVGSMLSRKVDFLIEVNQDVDDWRLSRVTHKLSRDVGLFPEFTIRQESHPPDIFRPDLRTGGWMEEEKDDIVTISSGVLIKKQSNSDYSPF